MKITVDIPDDQVAEFARLVAEQLIRHRPGAHPAESGHPPPGPGPDPDPDRPTDGRTLLGWADRHDVRNEVLRLGRARKYPSKVVTWDEEQVADVYQVLRSKPPKGSQHWGGAQPKRIVDRST
jgi:hypothetical protein